jgi:hypothetical protein
MGTLEFFYRQVPFGCRFERATGMRDPLSSPTLLFENEIVVDVGGECHGYAGCTSMIFDHHFVRDHNFPSAAAAVVHQAHAIQDYFGNLQDRCNPGKIWIVYHKDPDFDACCAAFLARLLISGGLLLPGADWLINHGIHPDGWDRSDRDSIDWQRLKLDCFEVSHKSPDNRWRSACLLASLAAHVDNCWSIQAPKGKALHSLLYAATARGRAVDRTGAWALFADTFSAMEDNERSLNPLIDSVLEGNEHWQPEFALLAEEEERYRSDLKRGRISTVFIPVATTPFAEWFKELQDTPLFGANGELNLKHVARCESQRAVDGIFLRDPECLLFKQWARDDRENSPRGQGFLFTMVAVSNAISTEKGNSSRYWISLDPERCGTLHLYPVWAELQAEEMRLKGTTRESQEVDRKDFKGRKAGADPWYDGQNFRCTIVDTPSNGSKIGPGGLCGDLRDDPVAEIVARVVEFGKYRRIGGRLPLIEISDHALDQQDACHQHNLPIWEGCACSPPDGNSLRFAEIELKEPIDCMDRETALHVGRDLWMVLEDPGISTVPSDFENRHLLRSKYSVAVWNRRGIAIAWAGAAGKTRNKFIEGRVAKLANLIYRMRSMVSQSSAGNDELGGEMAQLLRELVRFRLDLATSEGRPVLRFVEAGGFEEALRSLHDLNSQLSAEREEQRDRTLNRTLSLLSALFLFPSLYLSFIAAAGKFKIFGLADEARRLAAIGSLKEVDVNSSWLLIMLTTVGVGLLSTVVFRLVSRNTSKASSPKASSK